MVPTPDEIEDINRKYQYTMQIHDHMLKQEKRYKELKILVQYCTPEDKKDYESELRQNIESHHERHFGFENYESSMKTLKILKKFAHDHTYLKHPDLDFSGKIKRCEI
jgi:hypothetical protein